MSASAKTPTVAREPARPPVLPGTPSFDGVCAPDGTSFAEFRRTLTPRYAHAWLDLAGRWLLLGGGFAGMCLASARLGAAAAWLVLPAAVWIGFWFASIVLFMHEAAHFQLHRDKATNDRLANLLVCWMTGDDVRSYRALHWQHHLHLGDPEDTEVSYHHAPTLRYALETLLFVHAWRVLRSHQSTPADGADEPRRHARGVPLLRGLVVHGALLAGPLWAGWWPAVAAWVLGVTVGFPYFSALRNQLEHRSLTARSDVDYTKVPHGTVNRMFRRSLFARAFGSVGFDRHLLHHWDPSISYTRFDDLERFLMTTSLAPEIDAARTTYLETWRRLATG
ncbi:MAG TPA: fatty acid desaturase [Candidatus Limnocylindria bacterium]|nr:fatty acid desaturase [Candidatus Limnocylindria bacterium]